MSTQHEIFDFISEAIIDRKDLDTNEITPDTSINELGFDSLDYVEIQVHMKRKYGVTLTSTLFETQIRTIGQLCNYIADVSSTQEA